MAIKLDYTITGTEARIEYVASLNLDNCKPNILELCADYILHEDNCPDIQSESKFNAQLTSNLVELTDETVPKQAKYTNPRQELDYDSSELAAIKEAKDALTDKINTLTELESTPEISKQIFLLKRWRLELSLDAGLIWKFTHPVIVAKNTVIQFHQTDIEEKIDWTNPFHIKQLIKYYHKLRQSEESKYIIWYLEELIENCPLKDWQKHLIIGKINGIDQVTLGCDLNTHFNKTIKPSYMSQALRPIYRIIARYAAVHQAEIEHRNHPNMWKKCPNCGEIKLKHEYYWYESKKICKKCVKMDERRTKNGM